MSHPSLVVALSGNRSQGKDTLFQCLHRLDPGFTRWAFADQLKADLWDLLHDQFDVDVNRATGPQKELVRPILIAYGCAHRAVDPDHWVKVVIAQIDAHWADTPFGAPFVPVVTDARFPNEISLLRAAYGSALIQIDVTRVGAPPPTDEEEKHYREVAALADYHLHWGNETPEQQLDHTREVMAWLKGCVA